MQARILVLRDQVVSTKDHMRWAQRGSFAVTVIMVLWSVAILLSQPVTLWFTTSATVWMALLLASILWLFRGSFIALATASLTMTVVGRLFSTVQIEPKPYGSAASETDLLLQVETGPGVPGFGYLGLLLGTLLFGQFILLTVDSVQSSNNERELLIQSWALTFVRLYIGLMFVPHFVGHIFAGPNQFGIYTQYFAGLGLPLPAVQLLLAGTVELIAAIGLVLGLFTRPVALLASAYLLMSMLLGGHFTIGYVWILPNGGYEFGVFWAVMIAVFVLLGGGRNSADRALWRSEPARRLLPSVVLNVLAN